MNPMKFLTPFQSDEEQLAKKQREFEAEQAAFEQRRSLALRRDHFLNQLESAKLEYARQCKRLKEAPVFTPEQFAIEQINGELPNGKKISDLKFLLVAERDFHAEIPAIEKALWKIIVEPRQLSLDNFLRENKSELSKLPKPQKMAEPPFVGQKLPDDFYVSGGSAALVKKYQ